MGKELKTLKLAVGGALLLAASQSMALSLGRAEGSVFIGRPLDILIASSVEASEAAGGLCLEAEVLYGDTRIAASAITVAIHRLGAENSGALRVRVSDAVTEPFVTLVIKAGCQQVYRRSYTLLSDLEPAPATPRSPALSVSTAVPAAPAQTAPANAPVRPARPLAGAVRPAAPAAKPEATSGPVQALAPPTPVRLAQPAPRPAGVGTFKGKTRPPAALGRAEALANVPAATAPAAPTVAPEATGARLKLDPVDVLPTQGPASPQAADAVPQTDVGVAGSGSSSGNATAVDPSAALVQELEQLRAEQERMRLAMETMNAQLKRAETGATPGWWYPVGGGALALLAGLWLWTRRRNQAAPSTAEFPDSNPWWESRLPPEEAPVAAVPPVSDPVAMPAPASSAADATSPETRWPPSGEVEGLEVREAGESLFREVPIAPLDAGVLQDLWQRLELLESLGQYGEAMESLKAFVTDFPRASEAPYLRWLALARVHGSTEVQALAQAFYEHHFQRLAPPVVAVHGALESDARYLPELVRTWPTPEARDHLRAALSSQPGDPLSRLTVRSLEAYDDLLALLGALDLLQDLAEVPSQITPTVPAGNPAPVTPQVAAPDLSLDFPDLGADVPAPATPAVVATAPAQSPESHGHAALDFDFLAWEPPTKAETPAPGAPKLPGQDR